MKILITFLFTLIFLYILFLTVLNAQLEALLTQQEHRADRLEAQLKEETAILKSERDYFQIQASGMRNNFVRCVNGEDV